MSDKIYWYWARLSLRCSVKEYNALVKLEAENAALKQKLARVMEWYKNEAHTIAIDGYHLKPGRRSHLKRSRRRR